MCGHIAEDLTGMKCGKLTVVRRAENRISSGKIRVYWVCKCECGNEKEIRASHLKSGKIVSCGCVGIAHLHESLITHNQKHTRLYGVWQNMKNRCYNKNVRSYKDYGANGVVVCDEWLHDFNAFSKWAYANGYDPNADYGKCTIDRIDVYGNYEPNNCRWVDLKVQALNKRKKHGEEHNAG